MAEFSPALALVLSHEGKFVDDKLDPGGSTNYGISLRFYHTYIDAVATSDDIKRLTSEDAARIYKEYFWDKYSFAQIDNQNLCNRLFDLSVNCGPIEAIKLLQRACNDVCTPHIKVDGMLGPKTITAVNCLAPKAIYNALIKEAKTFYEELADHGQNHRYLNGWINRLMN